MGLLFAGFGVAAWVLCLLVSCVLADLLSLVVEFGFSLVGLFWICCLSLVW